MVTVRAAKNEDIDWLLEQLKLFAEFCGTQHSFYGDEKYMRSGLETVIRDHVFFVSELDGEKVGFIAGLITPHIFNPEIKILTELFWWVSEEHRNTRAGALLLQAFMEWGKLHAEMITFALEEKSPVNEETLIKRGFRRFERNYILEVA